MHHSLGLDDDGVGAVTVHTRSAAGALTLTRAPRFVLHDAQAEGGGPICPLPGTVIAVHVAAGDAVVDGQVLMVVEAMKMEHKIVAPGDATVSEVRFAVGDRVDQGDLLVALDHGGRDDQRQTADLTCHDASRSASPTVRASSATGRAVRSRWSRAARSTCSPATGSPS